MLEYFKTLSEWIRSFFTKDSDEGSNAIGEGLTKEQKSKYRGQYLSIMTSALFITVIYIIGITGFLWEVFLENKLHYAVVVFLILENYFQFVSTWKHELDLIMERIGKRVKKNIKQVKPNNQGNSEKGETESDNEQL